MTLFNIPDFISDWRKASLAIKQVTIAVILASSYFVGFSAACGKALISHEPTAVAIGYGMLAGAGCFALSAIGIGLPISVPKFLYDEMAKDELRNADNAPKPK